MTPSAVDTQVAHLRDELVGFKAGTVEVLGLEGYEESLTEGDQLRLTLTLVPPEPPRDTWAVSDANRLLEAVQLAALEADIKERFTITFTNAEVDDEPES